MGTSQSKDELEMQILALEKQLGIHKFSIFQLKNVKNLHFLQKIQIKGLLFPQ